MPVGDNPNSRANIDRAKLGYNITKENAVEMQKKSAAKRRKNKEFRDELLALLNKGDTRKKVSIAILEKALAGDVKAFETIRDTIGEKPSEKVIVSTIDANVVSEIEDMINGCDAE